LTHAGDRKAHEAEILATPNIIGILDDKSRLVCKDGILGQEGPSDTINEWLENKIGSIKKDKDRAHLFEYDGSYVEQSSEERYIRGVQDIVLKHFVQPAKLGAAPEKQVITLISHSEGINPFLKMFGWKGAYIDNPCYCATFCVELEAGDMYKEGFKVLGIQTL